MVVDGTTGTVTGEIVEGDKEGASTSRAEGEAIPIGDSVAATVVSTGDKGADGADAPTMSVPVVNGAGVKSVVGD